MSITATAPFNGVDIEGPLLNGGQTINSGNILSCVAPASYKGWSNFSVYYRGVQRGTAGTAFNYFFYVAYDGGNATPPYQVVGVGDGTNASHLTTVSTIWNDGTTDRAGTGIDFTGNPLISCLGTFTVNGNNLLYRDGIQVASNVWGTASAPATLATTQVQINGWTFQPRYASASNYMACAWNRTLSASEASLIDQDPYCFLIPAEGEMPALFVAAAGGSFIPAWAMNSNIPVLGTGTY